MNTLKELTTSFGKKINLSNHKTYAQGNLNLIYFSLLVTCLCVVFYNLYTGVFIRQVTSTSFFIMLSIGLIINCLGHPSVSRMFLVLTGFMGVAIHSYIYGTGMGLEYLAMLFPVSALMLTDKEWFYKFSLLSSFLFFSAIQLLDNYHTPLVDESSSILFQKIIVGGSILGMSFIILKRFKSEMQKAQQKTLESFSDLERFNNALRESESRYKAIFENAFDGILVINTKTWSTVSCNQKMLDYFGIEEDLFAKKCITKHFREKGILNLSESLETLKKEGTIRKKAKIYQPQGKSIFGDITCVLLPPPNNQLVVVIIKDISMEIVAKRKMLEANEELKNFAHAASHDLKEPLRMISSFGQLLQKKNDGKMSSENEEFLGFIIDASNRMTTLVNDLLEYSTAANSTPKEQVVDLEDVLQVVMKNIRLQVIENQGVIYTGLLPKVNGSTTLLIQVFQNIISNAIKFKRPEIAPEIRINVLNNKEYHLISIRDNGIGIAPEYHNQVFGVFKRLHSKADYEGSGIGLATCKKIVEQRGGRIWVESEPGFGTSFHFTWPVLKEPATKNITNSILGVASN
jgi:PAS domain S-box-containing protein